MEEQGESLYRSVCLLVGRSDSRSVGRTVDRSVGRQLFSSDYRSNCEDFGSVNKCIRNLES